MSPRDGDGLGMAPRPGEPESNLVAGMAAPRQTAPTMAVIAPLGLFGHVQLGSMPDTSVPGPVALETPLAWTYDFEPVSGNARATYQGLIYGAGGALPVPGSFVQTFNTRAGAVTLTAADITGAGGQLADVAPTVNVLTSGSGATYTTPAGTRWLWVRMIGGGGGGGGMGSTTGVAGGTGGTTTFNAINAAGGSGGGPGTSSTNGQGGAGGTGGTGAATLRVPGSGGGVGMNGAGTSSIGGVGAAGFSGGGGAPATAPNAGGNGVAAGVNTGGGGSGAAGSSGSAGCGAGGGSGEYVELVINAPAASYLYTIGAGGTVGTGTGTAAANGGLGGSGIIVVQAFA